MTQAPEVFPGLSDALQEQARRAKALGLAVTHYNSGVKRNPKNGTRIHWDDGRADYFKTPHLAHLRTLAEVNAWLDGFTTPRA